MHRASEELTVNPYRREYGLNLGRKMIEACDIRGLSPIPTNGAPSTYAELEKLRPAVESAGAVEFPVFSGACETSIYGSPAATHAFRALHDYFHIYGRWGFDLYGEINTAQEQEDVLGCLSAEEQLTFRIDSIGQPLLHFLTGGKFPEDQEAFVTWVYREFNLIARNINPKLGENYMQTLQRAVYSYYVSTCGTT